MSRRSMMVAPRLRRSDAGQRHRPTFRCPQHLEAGCNVLLNAMLRTASAPQRGAGGAYWPIAAVWTTPAHFCASLRT